MILSVLLTLNVWCTTGCQRCIKLVKLGLLFPTTRPPIYNRLVGRNYQVNEIYLYFNTTSTTKRLASGSIQSSNGISHSQGAKWIINILPRIPNKTRNSVDLGNLDRTNSDVSVHTINYGPQWIWKWVGRRSGYWLSGDSDRWDKRLDRKHRIISRSDIVCACAHVFGFFSIYRVEIYFDLELHWRNWLGNYASVFHLIIVAMTFESWTKRIKLLQRNAYPPRPRIIPKEI